MDVAIELIAERGVRSFSLAEASRRLGVTVAAPYRHFADRDDLIAAVAVRAVYAFARALTAEVDETSLAGQRLAAMTRGYVRFAAGQRPLFDTVLRLRAGQEPLPGAEGRVRVGGAGVRRVCPGYLRPGYLRHDPAGADALATALEATAHGHAMLLLGGDFGAGADAVRTAADQAARATFALIEGRRALRQAAPAKWLRALTGKGKYSEETVKEASP